MVLHTMMPRFFISLANAPWQGGRMRYAAAPGTLDFLTSAR